MTAAILIAGPTASGKSALALRLAQALGGTVINADSMQVYREFRVLTARPSPADEVLVPHRLYGILSVDQPCSAGRWQERAVQAIGEARRAGRVPIVVGGTGLYLSALTEGLSPIPDVPEAVRTALRRRLEAEGVPALHAELCRRDPEMAGRLMPADRQRILRALEVLDASGRSLAHWQRLPPAPYLDGPWQGFVLDLPRDKLYSRCDARLQAMLDEGALAEVAATLDRDPGLPAMKALGVPELRRHLAGEIDLATALTAAQAATRRYAKRQQTWFAHKMISWNRIDTQDSESFFNRIMPKMGRFQLTGCR